ncbi:MAG: AAA family ATPase [Candidatus Micrarchaeia archaeon]
MAEPVARIPREGAETSFQIARLKAFAITLIGMKDFWNAVLISIGFLSLTLLFPLYSYLILPLLLIVFIVSYNKPIGGVVLSFALVFPAIAYQAPMLAWLFLIPIAIMLFEVFTQWYMIAAILAIVSAPFAPDLGIMLGAAVVPILAISALKLGSKRTAILVPIVVFVVLLLSAFWQTENFAFLTVARNSFLDAPELLPTRPVPELIEIPGAILEGLGDFVGAWNKAGLVVKYFIEATMHLLFADAGLIQVIGWTIAFFGVAYIPVMFPGAKRAQTLASLAVLLLIPIHFLSAFISGVEPNPAIVAIALITVAIIAAMDEWGFKVTSEREIVAERKRMQFGLPGVVDLSVSPTGPKSLDEVGGYESTEQELKEAIMMPMKYKELGVVYGIRPPKGILLFGPPGTGKTLLMTALAKELHIGFYYIKCSEILSQWYGESEKNVAELFRNARKNAPCVLFFDEIDAIGKDRTKYQMDETTPRVLSAILTEMDGLKGEEQVIVVGATNTPQVLDPALLRPGRFDKIIYMPPPDEEGRRQILEIYTKKLPLAPDVDLSKIAKKTERFTGADISNLVLEAARMAAPEAMKERKIVPITMADFEKVLKNVKASVTFDMLEEYERFRIDFERRGVREEIRPVEERKVTWEDVIGLDDVRKTLIEAIELPLLHEDKLKEFKVKPAKGILMFGPPGCGKTLIAKAAANELKATFVSLTPADISRRGYDQAVSLIKETFNRARENAPAIIFVDEIESLTPARDYYQSKIMEDIVAQFLQEMDGLKELKNVILIGATNKPQIIDPALMRPGRFDKIIFVGPPNKEGRIQIFKIHLAGLRGAEAINYDKLGEDTEGYTGADIAGIVQEVKLKLVRAKISGVEEPVLTQDMLDEVIANRPRSVTVKMLREYLAFVKEYGERR